MLAGGGNDFGLGLAAFFSLAGVSLFTSCAAGGRRRNLAIIPAMTQRGDFFRLGLLAHRAGVSHLTSFGAGGFLGDFALIPLVFGSNYLILTSAAVRANILADTGGSAGGLFQGICQLVVVRIGVNRNLFLRNQDFVADGAVAALGFTRRFAGRLYSRIRYRRMLAGRRNLFHAVENFAADRAFHALVVTGLRAGGRFRSYNFFGMLTGRRNCFHLLITAHLTGLGNRAVRHTGRVHRDSLVIMRNFAVRNLH